MRPAFHLAYFYYCVMSDFWKLEFISCAMRRMWQTMYSLLSLLEMWQWLIINAYPALILVLLKERSAQNLATREGKEAVVGA